MVTKIWNIHSDLAQDSKNLFQIINVTISQPQSHFQYGRRNIDSPCQSPREGSGLDLSGSIPDLGTSHGLLPWNGVFVGQTSIQDVDAFAEMNKLGKLQLKSKFWNKRHDFFSHDIY